MADLSKLPSRNEDGHIHVVVEAPMGSRVKLKYEPELGAISLSRPLPAGLAYPYDWGFVPSTKAEDGDPLDALIVSDVGTYPGVVLPCRPVAVVRVDQKEGNSRERNDRVIFVMSGAPRQEHLKGPDDFPKRTREELEQFFLNSTFFTPKDARILGWGGVDEAMRLISQSEAKARPQRKKRK